jgi:integrase
MTHYLSLEEVRRLITSVEERRDRLIFLILYETGCSLSDVVRIKAEDVAGNTIRIKKPVLRFARISGRLAKELSEYIKGNKIHTYLFATRQSKSISVKRVRQLFNRHSLKWGLKLNPLMLRYYHIAHAYINGVFIDDISKQLGITKFRVFQVLQQLPVKPRLNYYNNFLSKVY